MLVCASCSSCCKQICIYRCFYHDIQMFLYLFVCVYICVMQFKYVRSSFPLPLALFHTLLFSYLLTVMTNIPRIFLLCFFLINFSPYHHYHSYHNQNSTYASSIPIPLHLLLSSSILNSLSISIFPLSPHSSSLPSTLLLLQLVGPVCK